MAGLKNVSYDDRDYSNINYSLLGWSLDGSWNASNVGRSGTLASARNLSATLTFTFPQAANAFYYYGIPRCCGANYSICIDCYPDAPRFTTIDALNVTDDGHNPPVVLFSQTFDDFAIHSITLKNENDSRFNKSQITVDQFVLQVQDPDASTSPSSSVSHQSTSAASTTAVPTLSSGPKSSKARAGIIAGGVVGIVAFVALAVALFLCRRWRRRRAATEAERGVSELPYPFFIGPSTASSTSYPSKHTLAASSAVTSPSDMIQSGVGLSGSAPPPRRETDAGPIEPDADDDCYEVATLPPEYEQVFRRAGSSRTRRLSMPPPRSSSLPSSQKF